MGRRRYLCDVQRDDEARGADCCTDDASSNDHDGDGVAYGLYDGTDDEEEVGEEDDTFATESVG